MAVSYRGREVDWLSQHGRLSQLHRPGRLSLRYTLHVARQVLGSGRTSLLDQRTTIITCDEGEWETTIPN
ncbi:hypothetical protein E2C01_007930 [Portunus trituberculatus]|uniref:Uncharacterized protein n=1 Tax=Portunus trituberculatus TaxID=210409 RepID=A0A5B7CZF1_PORTR|nr:hypothetical protein [Portunus trituberculatus]